MNDFFNDCFDYVMINEGGDKYVDNHVDSGGATRFGISLKFLRNLKKNPALDSSAIRALTLDDARIIAHDQFWMPLSLDLCMDRRVATALLDQGYLCGVPRCSSFAQAALKLQAPSVVVDGVLGPLFWEACNRGPTSLFLASFVSLLSNSYESLVETKPQLKPFLAGWLNRIYKIKNIG